ncbi:MAG: ShlB/FhaC/HecB family hemolysin secretion/activation protein [Microcystis aeruginosa SX13-01]|jgi:hemolysin activation/secretion protein|nr:ShlB/FhaC/HecB family hemolysin secretion/activation protein [Microcystis aeruginosa SX13-01]NCR88821.1 ShlB/FhaC/HecB family hemolysin secretion/activation protein [Microcystis aeruginosa G13-10]NCS32994.1 ShlB/FhaC/HecB family hemolysin secretion/activation protein [Microcystis aeruginosa G11-01]
MKWCVRSVFITLGLVLPSLILDSNRETNKAWAGDFKLLEIVQQTQPSDRFLQPESEPIQPLPEERKPVITPTETQPSPPLETPDVTISVRQIEVVGSTIFTPKDWNPIIEPLAGKTVTLAQLQEAADQITQLYVENGYITSRAVLGEQEIVDGVVQIQVIEGRLSEIKIEGAPRLDNYVRSRLELGAKTPLRPNRIEDQLLLPK